jgi:MacB-like periplasmic core domain
MLQILLDRCRLNAKEDNRLGLVGIWTEAIFDVLKVAIVEHFSLLVQDIGYALRSYRQNPSFFIVALTALALGIGMNSAVYSVVNSVLLRPLPFEQPEDLVNLWRVQPPILGGPVSEPTFLEMQKQSRRFTQMIALDLFHPANLVGSGKPERLGVAAITGDVFSLLGTKLTLGRSFLPEEYTGQGGRVVILSQQHLCSNDGYTPQTGARLHHTRSFQTCHLRAHQCNPRTSIFS